MCADEYKCDIPYLTLIEATRDNVDHLVLHFKMIAIVPANYEPGPFFHFCRDITELLTGINCGCKHEIGIEMYLW